MHRQRERAHRCEFGVKTSTAVTNARTASGQFIIGMQALPGSPYDGHTLSAQIEQVERLTGISIGHTKSDGLLERNRLAGSRGDAINALLVAAGHKMRPLISLWRALLTSIATAATA